MISHSVVKPTRWEATDDLLPVLSLGVCLWLTGCWCLFRQVAKGHRSCPPPAISPAARALYM